MNKIYLKTAEEQKRRSCSQGKPCFSEICTLKILALSYKRETQPFTCHAHWDGWACFWEIVWCGGIGERMKNIMWSKFSFQSQYPVLKGNRNLHLDRKHYWFTIEGTEPCSKAGSTEKYKCLHDTLLQNAKQRTS